MMKAHEELELKWGQWAGYPKENVVACSSGTAALHLAFEAGNLLKGSDVLIPDFCMIACPRAAVMAGLNPAFIDCNERLLMDGDYIFHHYNVAKGKPGATLLVHTYGRRSDFISVGDSYIVEDLAESHGIPPYPDTDAACWSLYSNKIVTSGEEGGVVAFKDIGRARHARQLRSLGFTERHNFQHIPRGISCRMPDSLAEKAIISLSEIENNLKIRRDIETIYDRYCPNDWKMPTRDVVWVYDLRIPGMKRDTQDKVVSSLRRTPVDESNPEGLVVECRHGFKPCSLQDEFKFQPLPYNVNTLRASSEVIYLPVTPTEQIDEGNIKRIFDMIRSVIEED